MTNRCTTLVILTLLLRACTGEQPANLSISSPPTHIPSATAALVQKPVVLTETITPPTHIPSATATLVSKPVILTETITPGIVQTLPTDWSLMPARLSKGDFIWDLATSPDGMIWVAASNGVWRYDGRDWNIFTSADGLPANANFMSITSDSTGNVVVAACPGGIYRFNEGDQWVLFSDKMPTILQRTCGQGLFLQDTGELWMGIVNPEFGYIPGLGAVLFDGKQWHIYYPEEIEWDGTRTEKVEIPFTDVINILPGRDGRIWFETNTGISSYYDDAWVSYSFSDITGIVPTPDTAVHKRSGLYGLVLGLDGAVWIGNGAGAARLNNSTWTLFNLLSASGKSNLVPLAVGSDGSVWFFAMPGQLLRFDGKSWWSYLLPSNVEINRQLAVVSSDQSLWLVGNEMIVRFLPNGIPIRAEIPTPFGE